MGSGAWAKDLKCRRYSEKNAEAWGTGSLPTWNAWKYACCESQCDGMTLYDFPSGGNATCCPKTDSGIPRHCSGCASLSTDRASCAKAKGGYIKDGNTQIACTDLSNWMNKDGKACASKLEANGQPAAEYAPCDDWTVQGISANKACCVCSSTTSRGGSVTATPFEYFVKPMAIGSPVTGFPIPRTAPPG